MLVAMLAMAGRRAEDERSAYMKLMKWYGVMIRRLLHRARLQRPCTSAVVFSFFFVFVVFFFCTSRLGTGSIATYA